MRGGRNRNRWIEKGKGGEVTAGIDMKEDTIEGETTTDPIEITKEEIKLSFLLVKKMKKTRI